jgi:hypothetical protein
MLLAGRDFALTGRRIVGGPGNTQKVRLGRSLVRPCRAGAWQRRSALAVRIGGSVAIRVLSEGARACEAALLPAWPCRAEGLKREQLRRLMHPRRSSLLPVIKACTDKSDVGF